jgi:hypothetical protein
MKNFAITGTGRCGTTFLSTHMNKSNTWTVLHEPFGDPYKRFKKTYYGEVNSMLIHNSEVFLNLDVDKKGIIFRNPKTLLLSLANNKPIHTLISHIDGAEKWYNIFEQWLKQNPNWIRISFENMTSDLEYLNEIFMTFGINDVDINSINLNSKINMSRNYKYTSFDQLPNNIIDHFYNSNLTNYAHL